MRQLLKEVPALALNLTGRTVVLTGAASGIGAALAPLLAERGASLAMVDIDAARLERTATPLRDAGCAVRTFAMDVADASAVTALPQAVTSALGTVSVLINNAGVALRGRFEQVTAEQFDRVMQVNFTGTVNMTRAFLPHLRTNTPAQIVNMSSLFGIVGMPGNVAYCASKFAVRGFSEALRLELAGSGVGVTVVHPGGVRTSIASNSEVGPGVDAQQQASMQRTAEKLLRIDPHFVARRVLAALARRRKRVVIGGDAHLLTLLQRVLPASYGSLFPR